MGHLVVSGIILVASMAAIPLVWISGAILHFYTAFIAYGLCGPGWWGYVAAGGVLMIPVLGQMAVFVGAWHVSGNFLNGYSEWLLLWLAFITMLFGLMALGTWIGSTKETRQ